jgi:protein SCO1
MSLRFLKQVGNILDDASKRLKRDVGVLPLFISVDPERDSLKQLQYYSKDFHPKIEYLTGTKDQVRSTPAVQKFTASSIVL